MKFSSLLTAAVMIVAVTTAFGQARPRRIFQGRPIRQVPAAQAREHAYRVAPQLPPALRLALNAAGNIDYAGTRVIESRNGLNRQSHTEFVLTNRMRSRIEFPKDSPNYGQIIVELMDRRLHYLPRQNEIEVLPPQREEAFKRIAERVANGGVLVSETAGGNVAGFPTELVTISNKQGEVLQRLWIEHQSGMILKRELHAKGGVLQGSFDVTEGNLSPKIYETDFNMPKGAKLIPPEIRLDQIVRRQGFQNVRLPADIPFKLEAARVQRIGEQQVLVQQYAGNGKRIALYQLKSAVDPNRLGNVAPAGVRTYAWQAGGSSFVLVGDLPDAELRELARRLGG